MHCEFDFYSADNTTLAMFEAMACNISARITLTIGVNDTHLAAIRPHSEPAAINSCDGSDDKHKPSNGYDVYPLYPYSDAGNAKGYFTISTLAEVALLLNSVVQAHINTRVIKGVSCKITCIFDTIMPLH
jgi:hypothetical protein